MTPTTPCERQKEFYDLYFASLEPELTNEQRIHVRVCDYCQLAKESGRRDHYNTAAYRRAHPEHVTAYSL